MSFLNKGLVALAALSALGGTVVSANAADVGGRPLYATMTGGTSGDPDGAGTARVTVNPGKDEVCWDLTVTGIATATAAHIHNAAGAPVVPLSAPASGSSSGCATVSDDLAKALMTSPGDYYVNVHNAEYPAGAIRGDLSTKK